MASPADVLMQSAKEYASKSGEAEQLARENAMRNEQSSNKILEAITMDSEASKVAEAEKQRMLQAVEDQKRRAYEAAGGEGEYLSNVKKVLDGGRNVQALSREVERKNNRSIFDIVSDPVGVVGDIVTRKKTTDQLKNAVITTTSDVQTASNLHSTLEFGFKQAEQVRSTVSAIGLKAAQDKLTALQIKQSAEAEIQGRMYNMQGTEQALKLNSQQIQANAQIFGTTQAVEQNQRAREELSLRYKADARAALESAQRSKAIRDQESEIAFIGDKVAEGMRVRGMQVPSNPAALRLMAKKAIQDPTSPEGMDYASGLLNSSVGKNSSIVALTPTEGLDAVSSRTRPVNLPEEVQATVTILRDALKNMPVTADRKANPTLWDTEYKSRVKSFVEEQSSNIGTGSVFDVSKNLLPFISGSPAMAALPFVQKVVMPMASTGQTSIDPVVALKTGVAAVTRGELTSTELIGGMSSLYSHAAIAKAQTLRLKDFGIVSQYGEGAQYGVQMGWGDRVNVADYKTLSQWVAKELASPELLKQLYGRDIPSQKRKP